MISLEKILPFERKPFLFMNSFHSAYWDKFMWIYSSKLIWLPLIILFIVLFFYKTKWKDIILLVIFTILIVILCDTIPASYVKPFFHRLRPSHYPGIKDCVHIVNDYRGGNWGFFSNHAANAFGVAVFASLLFKNRYFTIAAIVWSLISIYSRIYLGVHFLSDITVGSLWGIIWAIIIYLLYSLVRKK